MKRIILLIALSVLMIDANAQGRADLTDHPLVSPYEGSDLRRKDVKEFDEYNAFMGTDESGKEPTGLALEGRVTRLFYTKPKDRSILEVFRNYETAVKHPVHLQPGKIRMRESLCRSGAAEILRVACDGKHGRALLAGKN